MPGDSPKRSVQSKSSTRTGATEDLPLFSQPPLSSSNQAVLSQPKHLTVTELNSRIRGVLEPALNDVWVQGEISNFRPAASGHIYFSLKDQNSSISAAIFGWGARRQKFELKDGMQVLCHGKVTVYSPRGSYQITVDQVEPLGAGALQIAFEQLKAKLTAEGLFDPSRKRALPTFPQRIAVVTSPSGAAIQDMLNILSRRAPQIRVTVIPVVVQGDGAPQQLIRGLELANQHSLGDLVVLARGGGSIEDLWCFNDEALARAIAASVLPVVSAVGHEIDFTIADFVADLRAPTPSAAAEIVSGFWVDAIGKVRDSKLRIVQAIQREIMNRKTLLAHVAARVVSPRDRLREQAQRCDELYARLDRAFKIRLERRRSLMEQYIGKLDALSPLRVLDRGYALVRSSDEQRQIIRSARQIQDGQELEITFSDGSRKVRAE